MDKQPLTAQARARLSALTGGRGLSHAYLISGPAGSGKTAMAAALAAAMVCTSNGDKPCGACPACRKAAAGIHPDVIHVDIPPDKREILVEQARQMRADAWVRPNEAARKVYVIHNAQSMRPEAQNAILKLLEEGPSYAAFLLLADNPGALLPTIRSRCETVSLTPPSDAVPAAGDDTARAAALELVDLLAKGDELSLSAWTAPLEKWDREALTALCEAAIALLREALSSTPASPAPVRAAARLPQNKLLAAIDLLEKLRSHTAFNVGAGHLAGALCAGLSDACF